jgi:hypothetical protein
MAKAKAKTTETSNSVPAFIKKIGDGKREVDCKRIVSIMEGASGFEAKMWGPAIIGFGSYHYVYDSGHEGDAPLVGFSPRKNEFALYIANFDGKEVLLKKLGKHKTAKSCVYVKSVADIDEKILERLVKEAVKYMKQKYK